MIMSQYAEIENTAAQYLEFMIHGFMNGLITLQELEGISDEEMSSPDSLGILGVRERALLLDWAVEISGVRGKGTTVRVLVPLGTDG